MTVTKRAIHSFDSDRNQLPYVGSPTTYVNWTTAVTKELDTYFYQQGRRIVKYAFSLDWPPLWNHYSPVYVKWRVRDDQLGAQSRWSIPRRIFTAVRYDVYRREVGGLGLPDAWKLIAHTKNSFAGPFIESESVGRVQYAVCIHHKDATPDSTEGITSATDFTNPYVLFATDPDAIYMDTSPFIKNAVQ